MTTLSEHTLHQWRQHLLALFVAATLLSLALCQSLATASEAPIGALPMDRQSHPGGALQFYFYDMPRVLVPGHGDFTDLRAAVESFDAAPVMRLLNAAEPMPGVASRTYLKLEREETRPMPRISKDKP